MGESPRCCTTTDQDSSKELDLEWIGPVVPGFQCLQVSTGWETKIFWHSPKLCSLLYSLDTKFHSPKPVFHSASGRALVSKPVPGALITPMGMPIMPPWANDHDVAHLKANTVPMNLIGIKSAQWLWSFGICKIPGVLITHAHYVPWANYYGVAHLQTKTVPMNLIWNESAQWLRSSGVHKIPGALITPMGMPIMPPWANDMMLHIYRPRRFQWTWFGVNQPSGCGVPASARFQEPLSHPCSWVIWDNSVTVVR